MLLIVGQTLKGNMELDKIFMTDQSRFSWDFFLLSFLPVMVIPPTALCELRRQSVCKIRGKCVQIYHEI